MEGRHESDSMEVGSESADGEGDGQLQRTADRIIRILSQVAECLDEDEMEDMNAIVLEILELSKKNDTETREMLIEYYIGILELLEFCSGISVEMIQQAIRSFLLIEHDAEGLGKLVYDLYVEMILVEYPSLGIDMKLTPDLLRTYFRLLTEGLEEICHIRLMVVGMYKVGKTTLIGRLCNWTAEELKSIESTEGIDIFTNSCEINEDGDWEISKKDERERFYNERLQELVIKYGKRTQTQNLDSSFPEPEQSTMPSTITSATTTAPITATSIEYETGEEVFRQRVDESRKHDDSSVFIGVQRASKVKKIPKRKPTVSIWDFAGQSVYYSTHHFFLNARSTYLVVLDMSKKLTDSVPEKSPFLESNAEGYTCHDAFKFWMRSIYIYTEQKQRKTTWSNNKKMRIPSYKPTIILIGTHKDALTKDQLNGRTPEQYAEDYFNDALKCFIGKPILDLVHDRKFVISKDDESKEFLNIKMEILQIARRSPFWHEKVPANFILLEKAVYDQKKQGKQLMDFETLEKANETSELPRTEKEEIKTFLAFQTAFGNVMYYEQDFVDRLIILNPQWIINIFKIFVTHKTGKKPNQLRQWNEFETYGKLEKDFVFELLEENKEITGNEQYNLKEDIVRCMEYLNVMVRPIASVEKETSDARVMSQEGMKTSFFQKYCVHKQTVEDFYIMPCNLPPRPSDEKLKEVFADCGRSGQPPTLCMSITKGFLPPFVFHCIIATIIKELPIATVKSHHLMFRGLAGFNLTNTRVLLIWCIDNFLHVTVIFKDKAETVKDKMECCKEVKENFENLVLSAFNFHGKNSFDVDLFEYKVKCPNCPHQVPFQKAIVQNPSLSEEKHLSVGSLEQTVHCTICDNTIEKEVLGYWFDLEGYETGSDSSIQEEYLGKMPTIDMLADFAEEITTNHRRLAEELSIGQIEYDKIKRDHGSPDTNLVFHILYKWKLKKQSLKKLREAMKNSGCTCSTATFNRIVRREETEETEKKIENCMESLDKQKFESGYEWNRVATKVEVCIGKEYWILGIRLGIEEETMQKMADNHKGNNREHVREYLEKWWKEYNGELRDLVKALVKSSSNIDAITKAIVEIYSS